MVSSKIIITRHDLTPAPETRTKSVKLERRVHKAVSWLSGLVSNDLFDQPHCDEVLFILSTVNQAHIFSVVWLFS